MAFTIVFIIITKLFYTAQAQCDTDWVYYEDHCYYLRSAQLSASWHESRHQCHENGANLVSIHSDDEMNFIKTLAEDEGYTGHIWIGYSRFQDRGNYVWSDRTSKVYDFWGPGQPTDGNTSMEQCAYTLTKQRDDCYERNPGIDTVMGLLERPAAADGVNTFSFFFDITTDDIERCERSCGDEPNCRSYTYILNTETEMVWKGECLGRSDFSDYAEEYVHALSGSKMSCEGQGFWYSAHCSQRMGFMCKKPVGQQTPVTDIPTETVQGFCPDDWFGVGNRCFRLVEGTANTGLMWDDAVEACRQGGGPMADLASIHDIHEMAALASRMTSLTFGYWIGLAEIEPNIWGWTDNTPVDFSNWGPNQPGTAKCAYLNYYPGPIGSWRTEGCNSKKGYVCHFIKDYDAVVGTPASTPSSNCEPGYFSHRNSCFRQITTSPSTWSQSRDACLQDGRDLVSIHDASENAYIFTITGGTRVWIGLNKDVSEHEWAWSDGWPTQYTNWASDPDADHECAVMNSDSTWDSAPCSTTQTAFMCKKTFDIIPTTPENLPGTCPEDWDEFGGHCYWFESVVSKSWVDAEQSCQELAGSSHNGHLASVHSQAENDLIYNHFNDIDFLYYNVWIGSRRQGIGRPFRWTDSSAMQYELWAPGEPNGQEDESVCVEMYINIWPGFWNDHYCTEHRYFVCKAEKGDPPTTPPSPPPGEGSCPDESWRAWGDFCYWTDPDYVLPWEEAQTECARRGGKDARLASILTADENWLVQDMVGKNPTEVWGAWIGMVKDAIPDQMNFRWVDGTIVDFTKWSVGEPNDMTGRENCVEIYRHTGEWNDHDCRDWRDFVCKVKKVVNSGVTSTPDYPQLVPQPREKGISDLMTAGVVIAIMAAFTVAYATIGAVYYICFVKRRSTADMTTIAEGSYENYQAAQTEKHIYDEVTLQPGHYMQHGNGYPYRVSLGGFENGDTVSGHDEIATDA